MNSHLINGINSNFWGEKMDIQTLALAKKYTNHIALGIASMSVSGTTVTFVTTDGVTAKVTLPTPENGVGIKGVEIDSNSHLICTLTDNSKIDAGLIGSALANELECNVALGGINVGDKFPAGTSLESIIRKLLTVYQKPGIAIIIDPSKTVYDAVTDKVTSLVIKAVATKKSKDIQKIEWKADGETLDSKITDVADGGTFLYTYTTQFNKTKVFSVTASDEDNTVKAEITVNFVPKSYWGIVAAGVTAPDETDVKSLANSELKLKKGLTYSDILMTNSKICYAYPKSFGELTSIVSKEGYDYFSSYTKTETKVDNIDYLVYTLTTAATIETAGYKQIFA